MKISEIKKHLEMSEKVEFQLPSGKFVPQNFHVTEVGLVTKHFIDCGGTERFEKIVNFQLWNANDTDHRLTSKKLLSIIELSNKVIGVEDLEIEVEYQTQTIGKYSLAFNGQNFELLNKQTDCLAKDSCGIEPQISMLNIAKIENQIINCTPGGGCC